ncbi:MAG: hypothetical protein NZM18_11540, partial [Thermoflexales bacterium]|nr:hypothetical protein [Thermoflexales bacterium]
MEDLVLAAKARSRGQHERGLGLLVSLILIASAIITAISSTTIAFLESSQPRLNQAAPVPRGATALTQTFTARHNGLSSVELLAVVYPDASAAG